VIAAVCCAVFFIGIALVQKFRWRPDTSSKEPSIKLEKLDGMANKKRQGQDNQAMDISDQ